ncbi:MAG: hypothetical protein PHS59_15330 [Paludibacter sp.]|nr:hypothetical protein [Paludibacter sp.]
MQNIDIDKDMQKLANESLDYANGYFSTFSKSLERENSRFNNDMLYQFAILSVEKYFIGLLACYDWIATHHMPIALYKEAKEFETELTETMKNTTILVGKFEGICSIEDFGYRTPSSEDLLSMKVGIQEIKELVEKRIAELN